ncbi:MAG: TonB-dependent receptor [Bacteroidota bacterium]
MHINSLRLLLLFSVSILTIQSSLGQTLTGVVMDKIGEYPLLGVEVSMEDRPLTSITNQKGEFQINDLPEGWIRLVVERHGYDRKIVEANMVVGDTTHITINLLPAMSTINRGVVISAHRYPREAVRTASAITNLDRQTFRQYNPRTLADALVGAPGTWVEETNPASQSLYLRGLTGNRTLLMVDGIRVNTGTFGPSPNAYLSTIDPFSVEQVEVVRGSGSVQFGSDAMGGVTQVFTRTPGFSGQGIQAHGGGTMQFMSRGMETSGRGDFQISSPVLAVHGGISVRSFGERFPGDEANVPLQRTDYKERAGDFKARIKLSPKQELTLAYQFIRQTEVEDFAALQYEDFEENQLLPRQRELSYIRYGAYTDNEWFQEIRATVSYQSYQENRVSVPSGFQYEYIGKDKVNTYGGNVEVHSQPGLYWNIVSGVEYYQDQVSSSLTRRALGAQDVEQLMGRLPDGSSMSQMGIYSLHTVDLLKLRLGFGARANRFILQGNDPTFGAINTQSQQVLGNLSAQYPLSQNYFLTSSIQSGFRAPNLYDYSGLGASNEAFVIPGDSLLPERSITSQIGIKAKTEHFTGSLVLYRTQLKDLLELMGSSYQGQTNYEGLDVFQLMNTGRALIQGIEAELEVPVNRSFALYGNVIYTRGQHLTRDEAFSRIPPLNSRMGLHFRSQYGFWSRLEWHHAEAQTTLSEADVLNPVIPDGGSPSWNVVNLYLGYDFQWGYATLGLRNALDSAYRLHGSAVPGAGRAILISLQLGF